MRSFIWLVASGIVLANVAVRAADNPAQPSSATQFRSPKVRPFRPKPPYDEKDFDYWKPRLQPPYTEEERREAVMEVGCLINAAWNRPGWKDWVTQTVAPLMTQLLEDENPRIRAAAAHLFTGYIHEMGKEAIPALTRLLQDKDKWVRRAAVEALGTMCQEAEGTVPAIVKAMRADPALIGPAAESLKRMGAKGMEAFVAMLDDPDDTIRATAVRTMGSWYISKEQRQQLMPKIMKLMRDPSAEVRASAMWQITHTAESLPLMIELLHDKDASVRAQAVSCIPAIREAVPGILELLKDEDPKVAGAARMKLTKMAGIVKPLPPEVLQLADDPDSWIRVNVARNLGSGGVEAVPTLLKLLQDSNSVIRGAAAESLGEIGPPGKEAAPALKALLSDRGGAIRRRGDAKWLVCHAAAEALNGILGDKDYLAGLPPIPPDGK